MFQARSFGRAYHVFVSILFVLSAGPASLGQTVVYVDASASGATHDGSSWCNAYLTLHPALVAAMSGTTIRVANGVYRPDPSGLPDPRKATFTLKNGVIVEGGYAGCGAANPNARDVTANVTTLSGDVADNDPAGDEFRDCCHPTYEQGCPDATCQAAVCAANSICCQFGWEPACAADAQTLCAGLCATNSDNSYHVVTASGVNSSAILDGVTITAGKADRPIFGSLDALGGGLYSDAGSPTLLGVRFTANDAVGFGGGVFLKGGSAQVIDCEFTENRSRSYGTEGGSSGGAAYVDGGGPLFSGCTVNANQGDGFGSGGLTLVGSNAAIVDSRLEGNWGAGIELWNGALAITRCRIIGNGGGIHLDGGVVTIQDSKIVGNYGAGIATQGGTQTVTNCLIAGNFAGSSGGGITLFGGQTDVRNCTIVGNTAFSYGGGLYAVGSSDVTVSNTLLSANQAALGGSQVYLQRLSSTSIPELTISFSLVQGGQAGVLGSGILTWGVGNIDLDPLLVDPDGLDGIPSNDDDFRLLTGSPCVDAGDNGSVPVGVVLDLDGNARIRDGNHDGQSVVDMGAYELQRAVPALSSGGIAALTVLTIFVGAVLIRLRVTGGIEANGKCTIRTECSCHQGTFKGAGSTCHLQWCDIPY